MLSEITLRGFKSFFEKNIELNRLNILTGLNNSGKSSIIHALLMMEKAANEEKNILIKDHGSVEEIKNIFYKDNIILEARDEFNRDLYIELKSSEISGQYSIKKENDFTFPEIIYISANRFGPKTSIPIYNDIYKKSRIGINGENLFQCIETLRDNVLDKRLRHKNSEGDTLFYNIRGWLSMISPNAKFDYIIDPKSDSSYATFNEYRSTNVGYGLSYSLPVITALLMGTLINNCIIIIENPEAHIHPRGQTEIAKLISLCAIVGTQIIVETHSDHILDGIRIEVKNSEELNKLLNIYWFELNKSHNTDIISPVISSDGRISNWPTGFFDQFEINASKLL